MRNYRDECRADRTRPSVRGRLQPDEDQRPVRVSMEENLQRGGWTGTLWLETSAEDPGRAMTQQVRIVADGLAQNGIPMGLIPAGTGNLLARNLDLPLKELDAIEVALHGHTRAIDLVKITVDDWPPEHFAVMAGIGVDVMIM